MQQQLQSTLATKQQMLTLYRQLCRQHYGSQAGAHVNNMIHSQATIKIDLNKITKDDVGYIELLLWLPVRRICLGTQKVNKITNGRNYHYHQSQHFKILISKLSNKLQHQQSPIILQIQTFMIHQPIIHSLTQAIANTNQLRSLSITQCNLNDQNLQLLQNCLCSNLSLMVLDLSFNCLDKVGALIGKVLSIHSQRRDLIACTHLKNQNSINNKYLVGLCEVNLSHNCIQCNSAIEIIQFLKNDHWTKSINFRNNQIGVSAVKEFAMLLKINSSLISLDLRDNPGFTKQYSQYIYHKLVNNMKKYKQIQNNTLVNKHVSSKNDTKPSIPMQNTNLNSALLNMHYSKGAVTNLQHSNYKHKTQQQNCMNQVLGTADDNIFLQYPQLPKMPQNNCKPCKIKDYKLLQLQKHNLQLQLQLRRIKQVLLSRNMDLSSNNVASNIRSRYYSTNSINNDDDTLLQRMQQIMLQLTKIMQTIQHHPNTQSNLSNNVLSNANSMSNTIPLYGRNSQLLELSQQLCQDSQRSYNNKIQHSRISNQEIEQEHV